MASDKIRHLREEYGRYYFVASPQMRRAGWCNEPLGKDLTTAQQRAIELNVRWDTERKAEQTDLETPPEPGTLGWHMREYLDSIAHADKSASRRDEMERAFTTILKAFPDTKVEKITANHVEKFYTALRKHKSVSKAQRIMKDLRFIFNRLENQGVISFNPTRSTRVKEPPSRTTIWSADMVADVVMKAEEMDMLGAGCAFMIAYDTSLRPGDIRMIRAEQLSSTHIALIQAKTGRPQYAPIWPETYDLIQRYLASTGLEMHPGAILLRTPTTHGRYRGIAFTKDRLTRDVRKIMDAAGVPKSLQMRDLRRTASVERAEAGATAAELAAGTGHSIEKSQRILDTYNPASFTMAKNAQDKRRGRQKSRSSAG